MSKNDKARAAGWTLHGIGCAGIAAASAYALFPLWLRLPRGPIGGIMMFANVVFWLVSNAMYAAVTVSIARSYPHWKTVVTIHCVGLGIVMVVWGLVQRVVPG